MIDKNFDPYDLLNDHSDAINNLMYNMKKLEHYINLLAESQKQQAQLLESLSQQNTRLMQEHTELLALILQGAMDGQATDNTKVKRSTKRTDLSTVRR